MKDRHAIFVSLPDTTGAPKALERLGASLVSQGIPKEQQTFLANLGATKTAIESRARKAAKAGQETWLFFAGLAFAIDNHPYLFTADSIEDDLESTGLCLGDLVQLFRQHKTPLRLFLDAPGLDSLELTELIDDSDTLILSACELGEESYDVSGKRAWLQLWQDVFDGRGPTGDLTWGDAVEYVASELPKLLRKQRTLPGTQTPFGLGQLTTILGTIQAPVAKPKKAKLNVAQWQRVTFRGEARTKVKELIAYQKNIRLPDSASGSSAKYFLKLASEDIKNELDRCFNQFRERLGYKRKELESSQSTEGYGLIRTPDFDYALSVTLNPDDPGELIWRREIVQIRDPEQLRTNEFREVFANWLDTLIFDFTQAIDVNEMVDRIEDKMPEGLTLRVASDGSQCTIGIRGFSGRLVIEKAQIRIEGAPGTHPDSLIEQFLAFQASFGKKGLPGIGK